MSGPRRHVQPAVDTSPLAALREEFDVPETFPPEVRQAAAVAVERGPAYTDEREDHTEIPLVTIDPPDSMDLDQAVHVSAEKDGFTVHYAIADVAAFVTDGDRIDEEAWERGVSRYSPDMVTPLHPRELSEGAASLLPDLERPAVLWTMRLDTDGFLTDTVVRRATVRSRAKLSYADAQRMVDRGNDEAMRTLARIGRLRSEREWVRGGVSLELPDQEITMDDDGALNLHYRASLPIENWNAQISLLAGHAAAEMMIAAGVGILRTLPHPEDSTIASLRTRAWALGLPWPAEIDYPTFVRTLDQHDPPQAAMTSQAAVGLRGAGYQTVKPGEEPQQHAALAMTYSHVTAPLRRLVDRYASEVCLAVAADRPVPQWVIERLDALPKAMASARGRSSALDRAVIDLVEAQVMSNRVGERFPATVVSVSQRGSKLLLRDPAVSLTVSDRLTIGDEVTITVTAADPADRTVTATVE